MITQVRTARPQIILNGQDYYGQLAPYLLHFEYTDSTDGQHADDCQFSLADRDRKFINEWMPAPGATFDAKILTERWFSPMGAALALDCGTFYIDSVEFDLPEHTVHVKANSIPNDTHGKVSNETRHFENKSLQDLVRQIASENHLEPKFKTTTNPFYDGIEQVQESAFQFLRRHAEDAGLEIKIAHDQLWLYDPLTLDQTAPAFTLVYGNGAVGADTQTYRMSGGKFRLQVTDLTASTVVSNTDIEDGLTTQRQFDANQLLQGTGLGAGESLALPSTWKDNLNWNCDVKSSGGSQPAGQQRVMTALSVFRQSGRDTRDAAAGGGELQYFSNDSAEADAALTKAQALTRDKNKRRYESDIELSIGNPLVAAGMTFMLSGCGQFDGLWFIEKAHHVVAPMYNTTIHVRRTLEY